MREDFDAAQEHNASVREFGGSTTFAAVHLQNKVHRTASRIEEPARQR